MKGLEKVLKRTAADLDAVGARWAIIGGLAVATRAAPRFTQDVDFAISVAEAEDIVHRMPVRGYVVAMMLEQDYVHRLATTRRTAFSQAVTVDTGMVPLTSGAS